MGVLKGLGVRFDSRARKELRDIFSKDLAPCEGGTPKGRWNGFWYGWWPDNGPRMPKWNIEVVAWNPEASDPDDEYEVLFYLYQIGYFASKRFEKLILQSDRPLIVIRTSCWD